MIELSESRIYEFDEFRLDAKSHRLFRRDTKKLVPLTPKAVEVLIALVQNRSQILTKDELIDSVWGGAFIEESNLTQTIFVLRKTLGDDRKEPRFILTVPNQGYRFIADVSEFHPGDEILEESFLAESEPRVQDTKPREAARKLRLAWLAAPVILLLGLALFWNFPATRSTPTLPEIKTIAILPFEDLSEQQTEKYLGVSIADALAKQFGGLRRITVRPIQAVLKYSTGRADYQAIGRELQVDAVLEGRIQRVGERLRVSVNLIRVSDNATIWTENFDDAFTNFFAVQDSISGRVSTSLAVRMDDSERRRFEQRGTANVEAYQAYMRGRYFWNKRTSDSLQRAIEQFDLAAQQDPGYALAYTGLADCHQLLAEYFVTDPKTGFSRARAAAQKALELDPDLAEAHTSMAYTQAFYDWDWAGAEKSFKRALDLNPNYTTAHQWYAEYLEAMGRFDDARAHFDRALEIDPVSLILMADVASLHHITRDFDKAIEQSKKIIEIDPNFAFGYYYLAVGYARKGMHREAVDGYEKLLTHWGEPAEVIAELRRAFEKGGWETYQDKRVEQVNTLPYLKSLPSFNRAFIYTEAGERDAALSELQKSIERRERLIVYLKYAPDFDPLRDDPRFHDLVRQLGL